MTKQNNFIKVALPSLGSGITVLLLTAGLVLASAFYYSTGNGAVYDFLFGPDSSSELIGQSKGIFDTFSNTLFGNPTLNKLLYFAFWMLVGLIVYFILYFLVKGASSTVENIEESQYKSSRVNDVLQSVGFRLAVRVGFLVVWMGYWIVFVKLILPFSVMATRVGIANLPEVQSLLYFVLGLIVLILGLHLHVVFMRLIMLRVRLTGSSESI